MKKFRVLVVDDMLFIRETVKQSLEKIFPNVEADSAPNGAEAKRKIEIYCPDLIICDWEMPDIKGNELLRWLREHPIFNSRPFIMLTANGEKESIEEARDLGVTDYIVKPLTIDVLKSAVGHHRPIRTNMRLSECGNSKPRPSF